MSNVYKNPQVIRDLIHIASYLAEENMEVGEQFLIASEKTFKQLAQLPNMGKIRVFSHPNLVNIRQQAVKGFRNYLIFYQTKDNNVEILRVLHGARDIDSILDDYLDEGE